MPIRYMPVRRGLIPGGRERVGDVVAEQVPDDERDETHEREPEAGVAERGPPGAARDVDREPVEHEHPDEQPDAQHVHGLDAGLRRRELVGLHQRDRPDLVRQLRERVRRKPELRADLHDQLVRVERDDAVAGRDPATGLVLEDGDELLVGDRAGVDEGRLDARPLQEKRHSPRGRPLERAGQLRGERLEGRRKLLLQRLGDVDVLVQLVDRVVAEGRLHLRVLDDLGSRLVPGRVVEHLPVHPGRQDRDEREDGCEDDERPDDDPALAAQLGVGVAAVAATTTVSCGGPARRHRPIRVKN